MVYGLLVWPLASGLALASSQRADDSLPRSFPNNLQFTSPRNMPSITSSSTITVIPSDISLKPTPTFSYKPLASSSLASLLKLKSNSPASIDSSLTLPILPAQDSLIHIRSHCKRRSEKHPLNELRSLVASKRQRREEVSPSRVVRFHLEANQVHERNLTDEDLRAAWMSPIEQILVKKRLHEVIFMFRNGFLDPNIDSIRGIEFRAISGLAFGKLTQAKQYRQAVLSHQQYSYCAQLAATLSAHSSKEAVELALYDTQEAWAELLP